MSRLPETITFDPVQELRMATATGAILFDAARIPQGDASLLDANRWPALSKHGRGAVRDVEGSFGRGVLRTYRRGGLMARVNRQHYGWVGEDKTRPFCEFRLLASMRAQGLPVPAPVAAGYWRSGPLYRAAILTAEISDAQTLAESITSLMPNADAWSELGATLASFHALGICHADLNAHNVLLDRDQRWWLIDFDRGTRRSLDINWQQSRLARLQRSLLKVGADRIAGWSSAWQLLIDAHDHALRHLSTMRTSSPRPQA